jgi:hypothetical protein
VKSATVLEVEPLVTRTHRRSEMDNVTTWHEVAKEAQARAARARKMAREAESFGARQAWEKDARKASSEAIHALDQIAKAAHEVLRNLRSQQVDDVDDIGL